MKYLLFASLIFVLSTLCTQAKKIDTYIMDGGVEKTDPNGNTYCGFEWAVADYTTGVMECHGEGNIHCDDVHLRTDSINLKMI